MAPRLLSCFRRRSDHDRDSEKVATEEQRRGGAVLVELFSSQGCASSPEAELLFSRLGRGDFAVEAPLILLAYHGGCGIQSSIGGGLFRSRSSPLFASTPSKLFSSTTDEVSDSLFTAPPRRRHAPPPRRCRTCRARRAISSPDRGFPRRSEAEGTVVVEAPMRERKRDREDKMVAGTMRENCRESLILREQFWERLNESTIQFGFQ